MRYVYTASTLFILYAQAPAFLAAIAAALAAMEWTLAAVADERQASEAAYLAAVRARGERRVNDYVERN